MAFARPTLADLVARIQADFVSRLDLSGAVLRRSMVYVLARVMAGAAHMLHGHLDFLAKQLFPDASEAEYLVRQAGIFGLTRTPATFARATLTLAGTNPATIPAGTVLVRADGARYALDADAGSTGLGGYSPADVTALEAGSDSTLTVGVYLTFESPISGVTSLAPVAAVLADGDDVETIDSLRARLLARLAEPPRGGTEADYIAWARAVAGVTRVWVSPGGLGPGTVVVRFVRDADASPIPDAGEVAAVQAALDANRPAHAAVTAWAPVAAPVNFDISVTPATVAVQAAVEAELADLVLRRGEPGGTLLLSEMRTAIGTAPGVTDYTLISPVADLTFTANQLPTMGTVSW